ncbi:unnamed protein product [Acidithrix sp. C25]|nr:unnamed protein product [Acidithrix sp. C25]
MVLEVVCNFLKTHHLYLLDLSALLARSFRPKRAFIIVL